MEDIYTDSPVSDVEIMKTLEELFPELVVFHYDFNEGAPAKLDSNRDDHVFFNTEFYSHKPEFGFKISLYRTSEEDYQERQIYLAKAFSEKHSQRFIVSFTYPDEPNTPYYCLVFENGTVYLADDGDTAFGDDSEGLVKMIREYALPDIRFDGKAKKINS